MQSTPFAGQLRMVNVTTRPKNVCMFLVQLINIESFTLMISYVKDWYITYMKDDAYIVREINKVEEFDTIGTYRK